MLREGRKLRISYRAKPNAVRRLINHLGKEQNSVMDRILSSQFYHHNRESLGLARCVLLSIHRIAHGDSLVRITRQLYFARSILPFLCD